MKHKRLFVRLQYIFLYAIGFIIIGITSLIEGDMKRGNLRDMSYHLDNLLTYTAIVCIIAATMIWLVTSFKEEDPQYKTAETKIKHFAENTYRPSIFTRFSDEINRVRKIRQHKSNTQKALSDLERKYYTRDDVHVTWRKWKDDQLSEAEKKLAEQEALKCPYCLQREELVNQLDEKWIEDNIDRHYVKYDRIDSSIILTGHYNKAKNDTPNDFITKHKSYKIVTARAPLLLLSFGIITFAGSLALSIAFNATAIVTIVTKTFVLLYQVFLTYRYAMRYNEEVTLYDAVFRASITVEYKAWLRRKNLTEVQDGQSDRLNRPVDNDHRDSEVHPQGLHPSPVNQ